VGTAAAFEIHRTSARPVGSSGLEVTLISRACERGGWREVKARAAIDPGRRRGPLSGVDLPPERWP
jgi:hypothetical protein